MYGDKMGWNKNTLLYHSWLKVIKCVEIHD